MKVVALITEPKTIDTILAFLRRLCRARHNAGIIPSAYQARARMQL
jgi:hypothetical protein